MPSIHIIFCRSTTDYLHQWTNSASTATPPIATPTCSLGGWVNFCLFTSESHLSNCVYNTRYKLILTYRAVILNINKDGRADCVWRLPSIWQKVINKGGDYIEGYINVVPIGIKPCQKYRTVAIIFYPILVHVRSRDLKYFKTNFFIHCYLETLQHLWSYRV